MEMVANFSRIYHNKNDFNIVCKACADWLIRDTISFENRCWKATVVSD